MSDSLRRKKQRAPQDKAGGDPESREGFADRIGREEQLAELNLRFENFSDAARAYEAVLAEAESSGEPPVRIAYLCRQLAECHIGRGEAQAALSYVERALSALSDEHVSDDHAAAVSRAVVQARGAKALYDLGRYEESQSLGLKAYELLRRTNLNTEIGRVELVLGGTWFRCGDMEKAKEYCQRALASFERERSEEDLANAYNNLGLICKSACQWKEATRYLERARMLAEKLGHSYGVASRCLNLGLVKTKLAEWELAGHYLGQALRRFSEIGNQPGVAKAHVALGQLHLKLREWRSSETHLKEGLAVARRGSFGREAVLAQEFLGELQLETGRIQEAAETLSRALSEAEALGMPADLEGEIARRMAEVALERGDAGEALVMAERSVAACEVAGDVLEGMIARRVRARALIAQGAEEPGLDEMRDVAGRLREMGERYQLALTCVALASAMVGPEGSSNGSGVAAAALGLLREASETFAALGLRGLQASVQLETARAEGRQGNLDRALDALDRGLALLNGLEEPVLRARLTAERKRLEELYAPDPELASPEMRTFLELDHLVREGCRADELLNAILRKVISRTGSDRGFVATDLGQEPRISCAAGMGKAEAGRLLRAIRSRAGEIRRRPLVVTNVHHDSRFADDVDSLGGAGCFVLMPFNVPWEGESAVFVARAQDNPLGAYSQGDLNKLAVLVNFAATALFEVEHSELLRENVRLRGRLQSKALPEGVVTRNREMLEILRLIEKVGDTKATVLLEGETGTGKGLLARAIHRASSRRSGPFFQINCAALPEPLLESELFGHVHGAFTGAVSNKRGLFEEANGGTIFLDEVDKMGAALQSKLLHVLDRQEIRPVGSNKWRKVDVRVICATNVDLRRRIAEGRFLDDLYYRMNDIDIRVPPLRERKDDIPVLTAHFVRLFSEELGKRVGGIAPDVMERFLSHDWRGNVRELEKTVKRMIMLAEEGQRLEAHLLPAELRPRGKGSVPARSRRLREEVARTERRAISEALEACGWNKSEVARQLGISYPCLLKKIKDLRIERKRESSAEADS